MRCQRCLQNEAQYRATTDVIDIKICRFYADEARELGISVEKILLLFAKEADTLGQHGSADSQLLLMSHDQTAVQKGGSS